jgi:CHAT domain
MDGQRIAVTVHQDGRVSARRAEDDAQSPDDAVCWSGLDRTLVQLFERWLTLRDRAWEEDEIRAFGDLLHRCVFPENVWSWVERQLDRGGTTRLSLTFPADGHYARLAAVPWEYLHVPDRPGRAGRYLAAAPDIVLSRYIPSESGRGSLRTEDAVRLLAVVAQPDDGRLGPVDADPVLAELKGLDPARYHVTECRNPTMDGLGDALRSARPHLVHFMGHGEFDAERAQGSIALRREGGGTNWVDDRHLAGLLQWNRPLPRVVVLHSCDGARTDFQASFAGLAPQLVRAGVQCVVAMQYAVTNATAIAFSSAFYAEVAAGRALDEAVQACRWRISSRHDRDPRLLGVPVVYLHSRDAVLAP